MIFHHVTPISYNNYILTCFPVTSKLFQKWCSSGAVNASICRKTIDSTGYSGTFQDTAMADEKDVNGSMVLVSHSSNLHLYFVNKVYYNFIGHASVTFQLCPMQ